MVDDVDFAQSENSVPNVDELKEYARIEFRVAELGCDKMVCTSPFLVRSPETGYPVQVPCGNCVSCRLARSKEWACRIIHEMGEFEDSCFITLTYADEYLPEGGTLVKADLQKYLKRLRRDLGDRKIKYYAAGEYGDEKKRPHYHLIMLGLHIKNDADVIKDNWPFGMVHIGTVSFDSASYVTSYVQKKWNGKLAQSVYGDKLAPFALLSKGIGKRFALKNAETLQENMGFTVNGVKQTLPRYYRGLLDIDRNRLKEHAVALAKERIEHYMNNGCADLSEVSEAIRQADKQRSENIRARIRNYDKKTKC